MTVLDDIVAGVREDLAARQATTSLDELKERAARVPGALECVSRLKADDAVAVIAEVKRSSPSKGALASISDPAELAGEYEKAAPPRSRCSPSSGVSTEPRGPGRRPGAGRRPRAPQGLRRDAVPGVGGTRARRDIVLLIVAALEQTVLTSLVERVHSLGMTALVEVHTLDEVTRALDAGARVVGVNSRDLKTLDVDRTTFARLAPAIPDEVVRVAESGVRGPTTSWTTPVPARTRCSSARRS